MLTVRGLTYSYNTWYWAPPKPSSNAGAFPAPIQEPESQYLLKLGPAEADPPCTADVSSHSSVCMPCWILKPLWNIKPVHCIQGKQSSSLVGASTPLTRLEARGWHPLPLRGMVRGKCSHTFSQRNSLFNLSPQPSFTFQLAFEP